MSAQTMYWLMSADAIARIAIGLAVLLVLLPRLVWPPPRGTPFIDQFFWSIGAGIIAITVCGQLLTLASLFSLLTLLGLAVAAVILARARRRGQHPFVVVRSVFEASVLAVLNVFERRLNVRRRIRRSYRRAVLRLREKTSTPQARMRIGAWTALVIVAAAFRLYRPLATANLGFSDTYVHLYLLKLLEEGRQVDPEWGPYPRGLHFVLMAVQLLTNVDEILLMNFFGAFVGVLMAVGVAAAAWKLAGNMPAGLAAGLLYATLVGGPAQYFILGGAISTSDVNLARVFRTLSYDELSRRGEFDIALTAFQRQTSTLSQELAIALLLPALMFLLSYLRERQSWHLAGFAGSAAAIAAVHSGVVIPLVLLSILAAVCLLVDGTLNRIALRRAAAVAIGAVAIGSAWLIALIAYPYAGGARHITGESSVGTAALYYFPFLRRFARDPEAVAAAAQQIYVSLTPGLILCSIAAAALVAVAFRDRGERRGNLLWAAGAFFLFMTMHFASMLRLPQLVETMRNSQWLLMMMCIVPSVAVAQLPRVFDRIPRPRIAVASVAAVFGILWLSRVPLLSQPVMHDRIVNYSGYGTSALAVLRIERTLQPYTWTLVSYGQEFPMVLRRGFHVPAADFLTQYDPEAALLPIPTQHVFIVVEKTPHQFEINDWARRFTRADVEQRLQTWVHLYQATHANLRVFLEDENVRVYHIGRSQEELEALTRQASR